MTVTANISCGIIESFEEFSVYHFLEKTSFHRNCSIFKITMVKSKFLLKLLHIGPQIK